MKDKRYNSHFLMPQSHSIMDWQRFFEELMLVDYFAPLYAVMAYYHIILDKVFWPLPALHCRLYRDIGIEMYTGRYPAYDAAVNTGFFQEGIRLIVSTAVLNSSERAALVTLVRGITKHAGGTSLLSKDVAHLAETILEQDAVFETSDTAPAKIPDEGSTDEKIDRWVKRFEGEMLANPFAAGAILSYFLEAKVGSTHMIYCPLGYAPYEEAGQEMAQDMDALEAARKSGLLVTGIDQIISSALSNEDCWNDLMDGVVYLINDALFRDFIPYRIRYLVVGLLKCNPDITTGKLDWYNTYKSLKAELGDEERGF